MKRVNKFLLTYSREKKSFNYTALGSKTTKKKKKKEKPTIVLILLLQKKL